MKWRLYFRILFVSITANENKCGKYNTLSVLIYVRQNFLTRVHVIITHRSFKDQKSFPPSSPIPSLNPMNIWILLPVYESFHVSYVNDIISTFITREIIFISHYESKRHEGKIMCLIIRKQIYYITNFY